MIANKYPDLHGIKYDIKLRPDGTCIIHQAKTYSREEVKQLCIKAYLQGGIDESCKDIRIDQWIENNL
jgi:hypothetical protein